MIPFQARRMTIKLDLLNKAQKSVYQVLLSDGNGYQAGPAQLKGRPKTRRIPKRKIPADICICCGSLHVLESGGVSVGDRESSLGRFPIGMAAASSYCEAMIGLVFLRAKGRCRLGCRRGGRLNTSPGPVVPRPGFAVVSLTLLRLAF
jgi:hypothetical protein